MSNYNSGVSDLPPQKQSEVQSLDSTQLHRQLFERSRSIMLLVDPSEGYIIDANPAACAFYGYSLIQLQQMKIFQLNTLSEAEVKAEMRQASSEQRSQFLFQHRLASGELREVEIYSSPVELFGRQLLFSIVYDVTGRRKSAQAFELGHNFALQVMNSIGQGLTVTNAQSQFEFINPFYAKMLGYKPEELIGKTPYDITPPEDYHLLDTARALRRVKQTSTYETRLVRADGTYLYVTITGTPYIVDNRVIGNIAVITDLTERRQNEESQRRQKEYLLALHETTLALINRLDLEDLLETIVKRAATLTGTENGEIVLVEDDKGYAVRKISIGYFKERGNGIIKLGEGIMGLAWQHKKPIRVNDYTQWYNRKNDPVADVIRATVALPLKSGDEVIGVLGLAHLEENRDFNDEEIEILGQFAQLASLALENAHLYTSARRRLSELTLVQEVARAINSNLALDQVFEVVVRQISTAFGYKMVSIYLLKPEGLVLQAYTGYDKVISLIRLDQGVSGRVASTGEAAFIVKANAAPEFLYAVEHIKQSIIVPLKSGKDKVLGILAVESKGEPVLTQDDFNLLSLLAEQVSVAVENARLFVELKQSEEKYRDVVDNAKEIIVRTDAEGRATFLNPAWQEVMGYSLKETLGKPFLDCLHPDDYAETWQRFTDLVEGKINQTYGELRAFAKDGTLKWFEANGRPIIYPNGMIGGVTGTWMDITERRKAEEDRLDLERKLLEGQKLESLGILAGGIAHDFNNLLVGILGNAELALMELSPESTTHETISQIQLAAQRAADLTRQMLAYSGKGHFVIQPVNLSLLVEEMAHLLKASISKNIVLQFNLEANLPATEVDITQLRQVIMNLIVNASDALGNRSGLINLSTGVINANRTYLAEMYMADNLPEGHYVYFEIKDTGIGMDAPTQARIFDPFFTTKFTGRGLGLAAVLGIVRGHKGALKVVSKPGRGTVFRVLLPCVDAPVSEIQTEKPVEAAALPENVSKGTVLVVDDEQLVRSMTERILKRFGFQVLTAEDGLIGLELFRQHQTEISCVLLDMTMPHLNGEQTFKAVRQINSEAKVILMSGYSEQEATQRFTDKGLAGFLQKPFTLSELRDKISAIVP